MRDRDDQEMMESMLDSLLEAVAGKAEGDWESPAEAVDAMARAMSAGGLETAAKVWRDVAATFREERTTVAEFRAMTRRSLGRLAAGEY